MYPPTLLPRPGGFRQSYVMNAEFCSNGFRKNETSISVSIYQATLYASETPGLIFMLKLYEFNMLMVSSHSTRMMDQMNVSLIQ